MRVLCRAACTLMHTQAGTLAHFPKVKQMPNTIFPGRENQSLTNRSFLRAHDPLHIPPAATGSCINTAQAYTDTHMHTCQLDNNMPALPQERAGQLRIVSRLHAVSEFASTGSSSWCGFSRKFVKP